MKRGVNKERVLTLLKEGKTYAEISSIIGITKTTISWYAVNAGMKKVIHRPVEEYLTANSKYKGRSSGLKRRLLKEGLLEEICGECGLEPVWNGKPLSLQLDHRNGINDDNRLENLRLLCGNCHTQTETYCKNKMPR